MSPSTPNNNSRYFLPLSSVIFSPPSTSTPRRQPSPPPSPPQPEDNTLTALPPPPSPKSPSSPPTRWTRFLHKVKHNIKHPFTSRNPPSSSSSSKPKKTRKWSRKRVLSISGPTGFQHLETGGMNGLRTLAQLQALSQSVVVSSSPSSALLPLPGYGQVRRVDEVECVSMPRVGVQMGGGAREKALGEPFSVFASGCASERVGGTKGMEGTKGIEATMKTTEATMKSTDPTLSHPQPTTNPTAAPLKTTAGAKTDADGTAVEDGEESEWEDMEETRIFGRAL